MKKRILALLIVMFVFLNSVGVFANTSGSFDNFRVIRGYEQNQFVDISNNDWYAESVRIAYELSLVNGTSDTTFSPNDNITIAEAITLASRINNIYYGNKTSFVSGDVWYQTYVDYAIDKGIINENEYNDFDEYATRAQFAQIFSASLPVDALKEINQVDDNAIPDVHINSSFAKAVYKLYRAGVLTGNDSNGTFAPHSNIQRSAVAAIVSRMIDISQRQNISLITESQVENDMNKTKLTTEEISRKCASAVFYIDVYGFNGKQRATGSGFFITSDGVAVTNFHVVANSIYIKITTTDGKVYDDVSIIDFDEENDLALLKVNGSRFPYLEMGDSTQIQQGQPAYAIGSPLGLSNTMSQGIISNVSRVLNDIEYIQISVPINHGSSGGALIDAYGEVIGITSAGFVDTSGDLNLAIPINRVKSLNVHSTADWTIWSNADCYPGFSQVMDFGAFSGVRCVSSHSTPISRFEEYDIYDFHSVGPHEYSSCYAYTVVCYKKALEENGMSIDNLSDTVTFFESDTEFMHITYSFSEGKILISAYKKLVYYEDFPKLLDFGWYSDIPLYEKYIVNKSTMYEYRWNEYYNYSDFQNIVELYFETLEDMGFTYIDTIPSDEGQNVLFKGNHLSIVFNVFDHTMYIDILPL